MASKLPILSLRVKREERDYWNRQAEQIGITTQKLLEQILANYRKTLPEDREENSEKVTIYVDRNFAKYVESLVGILERDDLTSVLIRSTLKIAGKMESANYAKQSYERELADLQTQSRDLASGEPTPGKATSRSKSKRTERTPSLEKTRIAL